MHATKEVVTILRDNEGKVGMVYVKENEVLVLKNTIDSKETDLIEAVNENTL